MKPIRQACQPRPEVLKGDLEDAIFGAEFGRVVADLPPDVYRTPAHFFRNTHPAAPLKKVITTIFDRLADPNEAGAALRLSTGFGGGKTHALIAMWHLARNIADTGLGTELLPAAGRPKEVVVVGIDAQRFGTAVCASHGDLETHSLWGELAYQIGGPSLYARMQAVDAPTQVPHDDLVRAILPDKPTLILMDELVMYMAALSDQAQGALLSFLSKLIAEVGARRQAVVVITDPAGQPVYQREAQALATVTQQLTAASKLDDVLGRKMSDFDPIGAETPQVIARRLFEHIDRTAAQDVSAEYYNAYQRVAADPQAADLLPREAASKDYAGRIVQCYPFHPRLLETAQDRLGALQDFNKSRGTLRLFARILRDIWESGSDMPLVTAGDLNWQSERIQADLLQRLNKDTFKAAVSADVVRHAGQLDEDHSSDIHRRVASALLLESLPMTPSAAMDKADLTLAVLRPTDVGHEPAEAMDRLMSVCWHTYKDDTGRKFQFRYEANANKIIEERAEGIPPEDARQAVHTLAHNYFKGNTFTLVAYPASPHAVSDTTALKLVLSDLEDIARAVCDYEDTANPDAPRPRRFRNAIFAVAPTPTALHDAVQHFRRLKAAEQVAGEHRKGAPLRTQVEELLPTLRKRANFRAIRAFNRVFFQGRPPVTLGEQYLVAEEGALGAPDGQARLKQFLDDNAYVYQPGQAIDVDLLLDLIQGATPSLDHPGAVTASSVHERALASPKLRLMLNESPVRDAILKGVAGGRLAVRLPAGEAYDANGCVAGPPGARARSAAKLSTLKLTADVLIAPIAAACVADWLKEDAPPGERPPGEVISLQDAAAAKHTTVQALSDACDAGQLTYVQREGIRYIVADGRFDAWQPAGRGRVVAYSWDQARQLAAHRPLLALQLKAADPQAADNLLACAQPFGAQSLTLAVQVSGQLKDAGQVNFAVAHVKHTSALQPLDLAKKITRACQEGAVFSAQLSLSLAAPLADASARFEQAAAQAVAGLSVEAEFGPEAAHD